MRRAEVSPAFVGSLALHFAVLAGLVISWRFTRDLKIGAAVPVTIVANAPATDLRPAEQAPQEFTAQTETPQALAPPEPAPPQPTSAPPQPAPKPARPEKSFDLDALAASLARPSNTAPAKPAAAAKGPSRPETAAQARPAAGTGLSAAALSGLADELQRRWNPNCNVDGGRDVQVKVTFQLGAGGQVVGQVASQILRGGRGAVSQAAAERAVRAVYAAAPFRNLSREFYGEQISVNFNAREACS